MCVNRGLNILQYEKKTQLINSSLDVQEMREGPPSLKGFCDLGLSGKLSGSLIDKTTRLQVPSSLGHLTTNRTNVLLTEVHLPILQLLS